MDYVVATETFVGPDHLHVERGTIYPADDPVVVRHPGAFRPVADVARRSPRVETADRPPGTPRGARR